MLTHALATLGVAAMMQPDTQTRRRRGRPTGFSPPPLPKLDPAPLIDLIASHGESRRYRLQIRGWQQNGVDVYTADRLCIRRGLHPTALWGMDFYDACQPIEEDADA